MSFENQINELNCHAFIQAMCNLSTKTDQSEPTACVILCNDSFQFNKLLLNVCNRHSDSIDDTKVCLSQDSLFQRTHRLIQQNEM